MTTDPLIEAVWKFVRGDVSAADFEPWVYAEPRLEEQLGAELYLVTISTDFSSKEDVWRLRGALAVHARARTASGCVCIRLKNLDVVDMGWFRAPTPAFEADREWSDGDVFHSLSRVAERGEPLWWLWAASCRACGQAWLVAQEERHNDVFCLKRLAPDQLQEIVRHGRWPADFNSYERLLRLGADAGRSVRFLDPFASSMIHTIVDLARARPGISVVELARLLAVDDEVARELARSAVDRAGVVITLERDPAAD